jgi:hypothetical protein
MPNVQPFYNEYLTVATLGMRANMEPCRVISRVNLSGLSIGFGTVAVRGSTDQAVQTVAQTGIYLGIVGRDPTVRPTFVDMYAPNDIMAIYTKGVIWVTAAGSVTPGQAAYYDGVGNITSVNGAGPAQGAINFTVNPVAGQTITLNGTAVTFEASGATGNQANVGTTLSASMIALLAALQASADTQLVKFTYALANNNTTLLLTAVTAGTGGNALTVATNVTGATVNAATLLGGIAATVAIPNAQFDSTAAPGALVKLRLN